MYKHKKLRVFYNSQSNTRAGMPEQAKRARLRYLGMASIFQNNKVEATQ